MIKKLINLFGILVSPTIMTLQCLVCFKQWETTKSGWWIILLAPLIVVTCLSLYKSFYEYKKNFLENEDNKDNNSKKQLLINRYQIHIQPMDSSETYLCGLYEAFSFDEACSIAMVDLKTKMDISKMKTPLKFWCR